MNGTVVAKFDLEQPEAEGDSGSYLYYLYHDWRFEPARKIPNG